MRQKTYYNENEIVTDLYTYGKEWQLESGIEYKGLYHTYISTGEVYTNPIWNPAISKRLVKYQITTNPQTISYKKLKPDLNVRYIIPNKIYPEPTREDILKTYFIRYFIKKQNESKIIEIDKSQYELWLNKKIDPIMYTAISFNWYIAGPKNKTTKNGITILGVIEQNRKQLILADTKVPGILAEFKNNYLQFYTDTDFIIPDDINSISAKEKRINETTSTPELKLSFISLVKEKYIFDSKLGYNSISINPKTYYVRNGYIVENNINTDGYLLELSDPYVGTIENEKNETILYSNYKAAKGTSFKFTPTNNLPTLRKTFIKVTCLTTNKIKFINLTVDQGSLPYNIGIPSSDTGDAGILQPNGQPASNELILQIRKTIFIEVIPNSYSISTKNNNSIYIRPITKHKDLSGNIVQNDNITAYYTFELSNNRLGKMIHEFSGRTAQDLGNNTSLFVAPSIEFKPNITTTDDVTGKIEISSLPLSSITFISIPISLKSEGTSGETKPKDEQSV